MSNWLASANILAMSEAMMIARKAGLDLKTFFDCIRSSMGNSFVWETAAPMVLQGSYDPAFSMELACKDNQLGYQLARKHKVREHVS